MLSTTSLSLLLGVAGAAVMDKRQSATATVPDYFQTTPQVFAGPTPTGEIAPFLAQTNPAPFGMESASYAPNAPLETNLPIMDNPNKQSIFQLVGQLSSYFPNPVGFGVDEYPLPPGANISSVNVLHRHGARYPTGTSSVATFGSLVQNITANKTATWSGQLSFLNDWKYLLGSEILVARGRQELFDSGVLHYYNYGGLYNTSTKIVARTTTEDRMIKSAEYFMAGFFGQDWTKNVTLEPIIEQSGYNNSLAGYYQCNNSNTYVSTGGNNASVVWENIYLKNATARLKSMAGGYNWTVAGTCNSQIIIPDLRTNVIRRHVQRKHGRIDSIVYSQFRRLKPYVPTRPLHTATRPGVIYSPTQSGRDSSTQSIFNSPATMVSTHPPAAVSASATLRNSTLVFKATSTTCQPGPLTSTQPSTR